MAQSMDDGELNLFQERHFVSVKNCYMIADVVDRIQIPAQGVLEEILYEETDVKVTLLMISFLKGEKQ